MTNAIKLIAGTSHPTLAREIAEQLGIPLCATEIHRFGNENILFPMPVTVSDSAAPAETGPAAMSPDVQQTGQSSSH